MAYTRRRRYKRQARSKTKQHRGGGRTSRSNSSESAEPIVHRGVQRWYKDGKLHRGGDQPAIIWPDGRREWYQHGLQHRDGGKPAYTKPDGTQVWYRHGKLHRDDDQPARIWFDGTQEWYQNNQMHRDGGKPAWVESDGRQLWFRHGRRISEEEAKRIERQALARRRKTASRNIQTMTQLSAKKKYLPADITRYIVESYID